MGKITVGYKAKKDIHRGVIVESYAGFFEPVYEEQNPVDELADLAYHYAHIMNDRVDMVGRIDQLVAIIKGETPPPKSTRGESNG